MQLRDDSQADLCKLDLLAGSYSHRNQIWCFWRNPYPAVVLPILHPFLSPRPFEVGSTESIYYCDLEIYVLARFCIFDELTTYIYGLFALPGYLCMELSVLVNISLDMVASIFGLADGSSIFE